MTHDPWLARADAGELSGKQVIGERAADPLWRLRPERTPPGT
ncbi:MAG TPA: hypothetical protein VFB80_24305 [Pirellulaceae bacterium]|nr:hypothetical protein [Pirellulaceae bacterium]